MNPGLRLLPRAFLLLAAALPLTGRLRAADGDPAAAVAAPQLTREQLDQLLGPIALYPDALVAVILPAATTPTEVVLAARYLDTGGDPNQIDSQPWSDSTRALARYPEVIRWMDTNLQWTTQLGNAFLDQPDEVMNAVQRLRAVARANGSLVDTPQQQVVVDGDAIEIVPAQADVIYVPRYDPEIVYVTPAPGYFPPSPYVTFGPAFPVGLWLTYDFDWRRRTIWVGDRHHDWRDHRDWRRNHPPSRPNPPRNPDWHAWHPPANRPRPPRDFNRPRPEVVRPRPIPGTPAGPRPPRNDDGRPPRRDDGPRGPRPQPNLPPQNITPRPPPDQGGTVFRPPPPSSGSLNRATPPMVIPEQRATPPKVITEQRATPPPSIPRPMPQPVAPPAGPRFVPPPPPVAQPPPQPQPQAQPRPQPGPKQREPVQREKQD